METGGSDLVTRFGPFGLSWMPLIYELRAAQQIAPVDAPYRAHT